MVRSIATPRPWRVEKLSLGELTILSEDMEVEIATIGSPPSKHDKANAALAVEAVNRFDALVAAVEYADSRAVSRAAYPHACIEERKLRDLIDAALGRKAA